jgi:CRP-like cAMP-binding protein
MGEHRVRLTDEDIELIVRSLRARAAMTKGLRRHRVERLADRLAEMSRGNPKWRLEEYSQTHEENLDDGDGA